MRNYGRGDALDFWGVLYKVFNNSAARLSCLLLYQPLNFNSICQNYSHTPPETANGTYSRFLLLLTRSSTPLPFRQLGIDSPDFVRPGLFWTLVPFPPPFRAHTWLSLLYLRRSVRLSHSAEMYLAWRWCWDMNDRQCILIQPVEPNLIGWVDFSMSEPRLKFILGTRIWLGVAGVLL